MESDSEGVSYQGYIPDMRVLILVLMESDSEDDDVLPYATPEELS